MIEINFWKTNNHSASTCPNCGEELLEGVCSGCRYRDPTSPRKVLMTRKRMLSKRRIKFFS